MGIRHYVGRPSPLASDEVILHTEKWILLVSSKTRPSYRIGFALWPLMSFAFMVTNRRFRLLSRLFVIGMQDISLWYPGQNPEGDEEVMTGASVQKSWAGRCLEITSYNPGRSKQWYWSPELTLRFYIRNPEPVARIILDAMEEAR